MAAFAFLAAAVWLGVSLISGFACLFVFLLAAHAVRLYQQRSDSREEAETSSRERRSRHSRIVAEEPGTARRRSRSADRPVSSRRLYDADREDLGWAAAGEPTW